MNKNTLYQMTKHPGNSILAGVLNILSLGSVLNRISKKRFAKQLMVVGLLMMPFLVQNSWGQTTYNLVTSTSQLVAGSKYIIANSGTAGSGVGVLGYQATNNRPASTTTVTVTSGLQITLTPASTTGATSSAYELTLGGSSGAWTLTDAVYAINLSSVTSSSNNYLKSGAGTWTILISSNAAVMTCSVGTNNILRYNSSSTLFSCYSSGQAAVYLYQLAPAKQFRSLTSGQWGSTSTWQQSTDGGSTWGAASTTPTSSDGLVTIQNGHTVTLAAAATASSIVINSGGTLSTGTTAANTLSVTGTTTISGTLSIDNTGTHTFTGDVTINSGGAWTETAIATLSFGGSLANAGTFTALGGIHTFTGTTKTFSGANTISIPSTTINGTYTNSGTLTISTALAGSGTLTNGNGTTGTLNLGGTSTITTLTATAAGNTVNYNGSGSQTIVGTTYVILTLSTGGTKTFGGATITNGTFTVNNGVTLAMSTFLLTINADFINNGSASGTTGGVTIGNTATQSIGSFTTTGAITVSKTSGTATLMGNVNGASLAFNTSTSGSTILALNSGSITLTISGNITINRPTATSYNILQVGAGTVSCGSITLSGTTATTRASEITISTGTVTCTSDITSAGIGSEIIFSGSGILNVGGAFLSGTTGTFTCSTGTINFNGSSQSVSAYTYNNLTLSGSGTVTLVTGIAIGGNFTLSGTVSTTAVAALTIGGTVTLGSGTTFTAGSFTHNVAGNWTNNGGTFTNTGSTINLNGTTQAVNGSNASTFNNLTLAGSGTKTFSGIETISGMLSISSGVVLSLSTTSSTNTLYLNGTGQLADTYGSTSSSAHTQNNTYFAGTGVLTVNSNPPPSIAISTPGPVAGNISQGSTSNILYQINLAVTTANATLTGVTVTTAGTYTVTDVTNFKLWYNSTSSSLTGATQIGSTIASAASGTTLAFTGLSQAINSGSTGYLLVTGNVASSATPVLTIYINTTAFSNITFSAGIKSGTDPVAVGGTQTIILSPISSFPWTETFDATSPTISGWTVSAGSGATVNWALTTADATYGAAGPYASTRFAYLYVFGASTTYNTYNLYSPSIILGSTARQLKYYYYLGASGNTTSPIPLTLQINVNGGGWTNLYQHTTANSTFSSSSSGWYLNTIDLSAYINKTVQFQFSSNSNYGSGYCDQGIDEFRIENAPTCTTPTSPSIGSITSNSASVSFTSTGSAFIVEYGLHGFTPGTTGSAGTGGTLATGSSSPISISGLSPATSYDVYVRNNCTGLGNGYSANSLVQTFSTLCASSSLPFSQGFNATTIPSCWSQQTVVGTTSITYVASNSNPTTVPQEGTYYVSWASYSITAGNQTRLVSPPIVTTGTSSVDVNFYWKAENSTSYNSGTYLLEGIQPQYSTDGGSTWTNLGSFIPRYDGTLTSGTSSWLLKTITSTTIGNLGSVQIGFLFTSEDGDNCSMDNVVINASPTCATAPSTLSTSLLTSSSIRISWTAPSPAPGSGYQVYYSTSATAPTSGTTPSQSVAAGTVYADLSGLTSNTLYYVWVRCNCNGTDKGTWTALPSFTTACGAISSFPWNENFDAMSSLGSGILPSCWSNVVSSGSYSFTSATSNSYNSPNSTPNFVYIHYSCNTSMWTPPFSLIGGQTYTFGFKWVGDNYAGWTGTALENTSQSTTGASTLATFVATGTTTTTSYTTVSYNFTPSSSGTYYFGINVVGTGAPYYLGFDDFSVNLLTPVITLSDNGTQVAAANVSPGATNLVLHQSKLAVTTAAPSLTGMTCTTAGTYIGADITYLKAWYSTSSTFSAGAILLSTITNPGTGGSKTFTISTPQSIPIGNGYIYITTDVASGAQNGHTINVNALTPSNFTFALGTPTGSTTAGGSQTFTVPSIALSDNGTQVAAALVSAGTSNLVLHQSKLTVTVASASLTGMTCTTAGLYISTDVTNLKAWYSASSTFNAGTAFLLSTITTPGTMGSKSFSTFTPQLINIGTGYIYITADIAAGATPANNISLNALATTDFTFAAGTPTGSTTAGGLQTFATPTIVLADNGTQVAAANVIAGTSNVVLHKSQFTVSGIYAMLTGMTCTTAGTYASADITNLKVYYSASNTFSVGGSTLLSTLTTPGVAGTKTFNSFTTQNIPVGTGYIYITADIAAGSTNGDQININALTPSNFTLVAGTPSGSTSIGGTQTIIVYCSTLYTTGCSASDDINSITVADLTQTATGCTGGTGYADYTGTTVHFTQNTPYTWTITCDYSSGEWVGFWIDFNDNGSFGDAGEYVGGNLSASTLGTITANIAIPAGANLGNHRMRVRLVYGTQQTLSTSCTSYTDGETHDYTCNIAPPPPALALSDNTQITTQNLTAGTTNNVISKAQVAVTYGTQTLSSMSFVTAGAAVGYTSSDITSGGFKLWSGTTNSIGSATQIGTAQSSTKSTATATETITFSSLSQSLTNNSTYYYWLTADIASAATAGHTVTVNGQTNGSLTAAGSTITGTTSATGVQTIVLPACATPTSLAASVYSTGQTSYTISGTFTAASVPPTGYIVIRTTANTQPTPANGTPYSVGANAIGYIEYVNTSTGSWTSTGLSVSTPYYYWVFSYNSNPGVCTGPVYSTSATTFSVSTLGCPTYSGTMTVGGSSTPTFSSISDAITKLTNCGYTGNIILELQSGYTSSGETFPITFGTGLGSSIISKSITIRPATGVTGLSITSANTTATIDLNGATYITFDGQPGGSGGMNATNLTIANTSSATGGTAVRFINNANNNTIQYANLSAAYGSITSGVLNFLTTTGSNGNTNNTITYNNINGAGVVYNGIYSSGTTTTYATYNTVNTVSNNNIYDFYTTANPTNGILISSGNSDWTITGNSIYQTASRAGNANTNYGIDISYTSGNNFVITGNYIGGSAASCGGSSAWAYTLSGATRFVGIYLNIGSTSASSVQNNTVASFSMITTSGATATSGVFSGIYLLAGNANIGTTTGNTIGSGTGTGSIQITSSTTGGLSYGIGSASSGTIAISNNTIGAINVTGSGATISESFTGISSNAAATSVTISGNTIGSTSTGNSINASNASTGTTAAQVQGISVSGLPTGLSITNNTIAYLNSAYVPSAANTNTIVRGINITSTAAACIVTGNTIRNLSTAAYATGTTSTSSVMGIYISTSVAGTVLSQNSIYALSNTYSAGTAATSVIGIYYGGTSGTNIVARNLVHSLTLSNTVASNIIGIYASAGTTTYQNNVVRLGLDASGGSITGGHSIIGISDAVGTNSYYFNSVYIGGTGVVGSASTYAFNSAVTTNTRAFEDNIFDNSRTNGTGTGKHYVITVAGTTTNPAGLTMDYNEYYSNGTNSFYGLFNSTDVSGTIGAWQTAVGQDVHSLSSNPKFLSPDAATPNLNLNMGTPCEAVGYDVGVTDDYTGATRASLTPTDIGAYAGNYTPVGIDMGPTALYAPIATGCYTSTQAVTVTIQNSGASTIDFTVSPTTVTVTGSGAASGYSSYAVLNTGTLAVNATTNVTMPATIDMTGSGTYSFSASTSVTGDNNATNDVLSTVSRSVFGGTYTVGVGGDFTTITAAVAAYNSATCINGPVTFSLTDASYTTGETYPITIAANSFSNSTNTLTIRPASGVTAAITGSSASGPIFKILNNYTTIDGSNSGGTDRHLTITNSSVTSPTVILFGSTGTTPITYSTIKNCTVINGVNTSSAIVVSDGTTSGSAGYFSNITIQNNSVQLAYIGVYAIATVATGNGNNLLITGNDMTTSGTNSIRLVGVYVQGVDGATVSNNTIGNISNANAETPIGITFATGSVNGTISGNTISSIAYTGGSTYYPVGIAIATGVSSSNIVVTGNTITGLTTSGTNTTNGSGTTGILVNGATSGVNILKNKISNIKNSSASTGYGVYGIELASTSTTANITVANNFIWDVAGYGNNSRTNARNGYGIYLYSGGGYNLYFNSVNLATNQGNTSGIPACLVINSTITTASSLDIRNNIFSIPATTGTNRCAVICNAANTVFAYSDNNDYYSSGAVLGYYNATNQANLAAWQTSTGKDVSSVSGDPQYINATNLHIQTSVVSPVSNAGVTLGSLVTDDIDGDPRTSTPDIGADEYTSVNCTSAVGGTASGSTSYCVSGTPTITASGYSIGIGTTYQWQSSVDLAFTTPVDISGQTTPATLTLGAAVTSTTYYRLKVSCSTGPSTDYSTIVTVTINQLPAAPVVNTALCAGATSVSGTSTEADGTIITVKKGGVSQGTTTVTSNTWNKTGLTALASGDVITATATSATTSCVSNTSNSVTVGNSLTATSITPATAQSFCGNGTGSQLTALNTGGGTMSYQWGKRLVSLGAITPITGATSSTYTPNATDLGNGTLYVVCTLTPSCGSQMVSSNEVTVNVTNPTVTTTPDTRCGVGTVSLGASASSGTINWYAAASGGTSLATGSPYTPTVTGTTTFYADAETTTSASSATIGTGTSYSSSGSYPTLYAENNGYQDWQQMVFTATELQAQGLTAGNITSLKFNVYALNNYTEPSAFSIYLGSTSNSVLSSFQTTGLTLSYGPATPSPTTGWNTFTLSTPYNWDGSSNILVDIRMTEALDDYTSDNTYYTTTSGNTVLYAYATSDSPTFWSSSPTPTTSKNRLNVIFAEAASTCASTRIPVTATVNTPPSLTVTSSQSICNNSITALTITSTISDYNSYIWNPATYLFTDAACHNAYTGTSATTVYFQTATAGAYTITCTANNSVSGCGNTANTTITNIPVPVITATPNSICSSGASTITATPSTGYGAATFQWQSSTDNITFTDISGATSVGYTTPTITSTMYYKLLIKISGSLCYASNVVTVTVASPLLTGTTPNSRCGTGTVVLGATGSTGTAVNWYAASSGGTSLYTGPSFTTPSISTSTTYYVDAEVMAGTGSGSATIGTGATYNSTGSFPALYAEYDGYQDWQQLVYTASELQTQGLVAGNITGLKFHVYSLNNSTEPSAFSIYLGSTSNSVLSSFQTTGLTLSYGPSAPSPATGWNTFTLSTPYYWDGTSNILVDIRMTEAGYTDYLTDRTYYTATSGNTALYAYSATDNTNFWTSSPTPTTSTNRLDAMFVGQVNTVCASSPRTGITATVNPAPTITPTGTSPICTGQSSSLNVTSSNDPNYSYTWNGGSLNNTSGASQTVSPSNTTVYTVSALDATGCNNTNTISITVNPSPGTVTVTPSSASICTGTPQLLSASGGSVSGLSILSDGFETYPSTNFSSSGTSCVPSSNTTYYVEGSKSVLLTYPGTTTRSTSATVNSYVLQNNINLTAYSAAQLTFSHICSTESGLDFGYVEYSTDGGSTWTAFPTSSYTGSAILKNSVVSFDKTSYSDWSTQFSSSTATPGTGPATSLWKNEIINIPSSAMTSAQFRIRFQITCDGSVAYYGWLLDNIKITGTGSGPITWSPTTGLYTDAGASTAYTGSATPTVYVSTSSSQVYTATATAGSCTSTGTSNITILTNVSAGTVSGTSPVCIGATPSYSESGGASGGTWSSSNTAIATVNTSGVVNAVAAGTSNITYTVNSGCGSPTASYQMLTVAGAFTPGTISSATQAICHGTTPSDITYSTAPSGGTTLSYQWYTQTGTVAAPSGNWSIGSWTAVGSASSSPTLLGTTIGTLSTAGTYTYALRVTDGGGTTCFDKWNGDRHVITVYPNASISSVTGTTPLCILGTATYIANTVSLSGGTGAWTSSNTAKATVNSSTGLVTAVASGSCNIIYTISNGCGGTTSAQQTLNINQNAAITGVNGTSPLCIGGSATYTTSGLNLGGGSGLWSSDASAIASVNSSGVVTGVTSGTTYIVYSISGCGGAPSAKKLVTISPDLVSGTVSGTSPVCQGATPTYTCSGSTGGAWTSSNTTVATVVSGTGVVTAVGAGTSNITYTLTGCGNPSPSYKQITVSGSFTAGTLDNSSQTICNGTSPSDITYSTTPPGGGATLSYQWYVYSGSTTAPSGTWSALTGWSAVSGGTSLTLAGTTIGALSTAGIYTYALRVTDGGATHCFDVWNGDSHVITVLGAHTPGTIGSTTQAICHGTSPANITYSADPGGGTSLTYQWYMKAGTVAAPSGTWSLGTWTAVNIIPTSTPTLYGDTIGVLSTAGTYTFALRVTDDGTTNCFDEWNGDRQVITVYPDANVTTVSGTSPLCINGTATYSNNAVVTTGTGTWTSDNTDIATVDASSGEVTGVSDGSCNIIYTISGGCGGGTPWAEQAVTINPNASIVGVTGTTPLCIGATATYTTTSAVLGGGTGVWSSTATGIATVDASTGVVTGVAAGSCYIEYTITGCGGGTPSAKQKVTITPSASIGSVTGTSPLCLNATATYNANTVVLGGTGGTGTWSSDNTVVATVSSSGLVTGVAAGSCNIVYSITGGCGTTSAQQALTINSLPTVSFTSQAGASACANTDVTYTTQSGMTNYIWSVPGTQGTDYSIISGGIGLTNYTVTLQWLTSGSKIVTINFTDGHGCTAATATSSTSTSVTTSRTWIGTISTDWNNAANWCGGIPTATTDVSISSGTTYTPHVTSSPTTPAVCNNLTINSGAVLTIDAGKALTVNGTTSLGSAQCLILKTDVGNTSTPAASFIDHGFTGSGTAKVEKYLSLGRWWYIGSPVVSTTAFNAYGTMSSIASTGTRELYWNEPTHAYVTVVNNDNLAPTRGYAFQEYGSSPVTATYVGSLNTGTITANLTYTSGTKQGFNLISNPYPSSINWGSQNSPVTGLTQTNIEQTIQYKVPGTYATWNSMGSGTGVNGGGQYIPAMQAFWVRVAAGNTTGSIQFTNSIRVHSAQAGYKLNDPSNLFRMEVARDTLVDESVVTFYPAALGGFENYDSPKMLSDEPAYPQLYSYTTNAVQVAVNGQPVLVTGVERIIPLGFLTNVAGNFKITATNLAQFDANTTVYLEDVLLNTTQNLSSNKTYTFASAAGTFNSRFKLHFNKTSNSLPIQLVNFDAKCQNNKVDVNWSTATETNNDFFTVERSADAATWNFVKKVAGAGNSNSVLNYSTVDDNPVNGISYYRLKQTDFNGQSETFSPVAVNCKEESSQVDITYYPNPFTSEVYAVITNSISENATVSVYNVLGSKVYSQNISHDQLELKAFSLDLSKLVEGVYFIEFKSDTYSGISKIVKN